MTGRVRNRFWRVFPPHADLAGNSVLCLYGDGGGPRLPEPVFGGPGFHEPRGGTGRGVPQRYDPQTPLPRGEGQRPQRRDPVFALFLLVILRPAFFPKSVEHRQNRRTMCAPTRCRVLPHHPGQRIRRAGVVAPYGVRRFAGRVR